MSYKDSDIKVLKGLDPVRKRPGMYIGSTDSSGLHHLAWEIFDNAIDEVIEGHANTIYFTIFKDNSISIEDNGRGIPIGINKESKISTVDTVFTFLHAGSKFSSSAYKVSGGLHGVGASVVNALSTSLVVNVYRSGYNHEAKYYNGGKILQKLTKKEKVNKNGTKVTFKPDPSIFTDTVFDQQLIFDRLQETSYLFPKLKIIFNDQRTNKHHIFQHKNGLHDFLSFLTSNTTKISSEIYYNSKINNIEIEVIFQYVNETSEKVISFANSVKTNEGGTHELGFKLALTEVINTYARKNKILKEKDENFSGSDIREGLVAIISVKVPENIIEYEGQTKRKLTTQEMVSHIKKITLTKLSYWFENNKKEANNIIEFIKTNFNNKVRIKEIKESIKILKKNKFERGLCGKLTPCQSKIISEKELFIVEGDSAGGSAKLGRNRKTQAILPIKGKIINVEKASLKDILQNEEINNIILSIGTSIGDDFDLRKINYGKIIIMTDADVDGSHIQILLLTFFYRYMKPLISAGHIYVALPPLYKISSKKNNSNFYYAWDEKQLNEYKQKLVNYDIQRYKGLGEMSAQQLNESTMDINKRKLIKVKIKDEKISENKIKILMGDDTNIRKDWILNNIDFELEE